MTTQQLTKEEVKIEARNAGRCDGCQWNGAARACILTGECHHAPAVRAGDFEVLHAGRAPIERALTTQVGGGHYKDMPIQPAEFIHRNKIEFLPGCVIKRMCRWRKKGGLQDLRKAIHEIELMIEMEQNAK